jgi:hypothetical protein
MDDSQQRWSHQVTEQDRHDLGDGIFANGSAEEIAEAAIAAARDDESADSLERHAMAKLTFYENRAGRNLSDERRRVLEDAKALVRARLA